MQSKRKRRPQVLVRGSRPGEGGGLPDWGRGIIEPPLNTKREMSWPLKLIHQPGRAKGEASVRNPRRRQKKKACVYKGAGKESPLPRLRIELEKEKGRKSAEICGILGARDRWAHLKKKKGKSESWC